MLQGDATKMLRQAVNLLSLVYAVQNQKSRSEIVEAFLLHVTLSSKRGILQMTPDLVPSNGTELPQTWNHFRGLSLFYDK